MERVTAHIVIPAPGVTPSPAPTRTPTPTATVTATPSVSGSLSLPAQPAPTAASSVVSFGSTNPPIPPSPIAPSPNVLWGAAAMAAIGAATGWALEAQRKRKEEEARARAEAAAANARAEAREAEERRRQAEATWRRKQEEAQKRREEEERRTAYAAQTAAEHQQWLSWSERQREALKAYKPQKAETNGGGPRRSLPIEDDGVDGSEKLRQYKQSQAYQARQERYQQYAERQPAPETKKPWWKKAGESLNNMVFTAAETIAGVEISRYARVVDKERPPRDPHTFWGLATYQAKRFSWGWQKVQEKIEDLQGRAALKIEQLAGKTADAWDKARTWGRKLEAISQQAQEELQTHWSSWRSQAEMALDSLRRNGLRGLKVKPGELVDFSGNVADAASLVSSAAYLATGDERAKIAADIAQVGGVPAAVRQVVTNLDDAARVILRGGAKPSQFFKGASFLGKVAGPLAIVTGAVDAIKGIHSLIEARDGKRDSKDVQAVADTIAGAAAVIGGIALLIPGGQPVAAVAFGISGIASGVSVVAEHWTTIQSWFNRPATPSAVSQSTPTVPVPPPTPPAVGSPSGTPTPVPTSTPSTTSTLPAANPLSAAPQITSTPTQTPQP